MQNQDRIGPSPRRVPRRQFFALFGRQTLAAIRADQQEIRAALLPRALAVRGGIDTIDPAPSPYRHRDQENQPERKDGPNRPADRTLLAGPYPWFGAAPLLWGFLGTLG